MRRSVVMTEEAKAVATILIREIQDWLDDERYGECVRERGIRKTLIAWVTANDLHPERVTVTEGGVYVLDKRQLASSQANTPKANKE